MKKLLTIAVLLAGFAAPALASNYPMDFSWQHAQVLSKGPALLAQVTSGSIGTKYVIGYKKNGVLSGMDQVTAHMKLYACESGGNCYTFEKNIPLGKEWNGTGFMSTAFSLGEFISPWARMERMQLSFFSGDKWDSDYTRDYTFNYYEFRTVHDFVSQTGSGNVDIAVWNYIVEQMRRY